MSFLYCTSGAAIAKAGAGSNEDFQTSSAFLVKLNTFSEQSEGAINTLTRKDWSGAYASLDGNFKQILSDLSSDMIATKIVAYDMGGYTSRLEAQTILDVLDSGIRRNIEILKEEKGREKLG